MRRIGEHGLSAGDTLQWVHGPRTVVMLVQRGRMTPQLVQLQWVHGPRTVVMLLVIVAVAGHAWRFNGSTVREPWLWCTVGHARPWTALLQWVHGPRTVVMASMTFQLSPHCDGFNGSTVREPWLC